MLSLEAIQISSVEPVIQAEPVSDAWGSLSPFLASRNGWQYFGGGSRDALLYGDSSRVGYVNLQHRVSLERLFDMSVMSGTFNPNSCEPAEFLTEFERARLHRAEQTRLVLENQDGQIILPSKVRGTSGYRRKMRNLVDNLTDYVNSNNLECCLLTLSARTPVGLDPFELEEKWDGVVNRLISWLKGMDGPNPRPIMYLYAKEPTQRGYTHVHIIFINRAYVAPLNVLGDWWQKQNMGTVRGVEVQMIKRGEAHKGIYYCLKYLMKPEEDLAWYGMQSLRGGRVFSMGHTLKHRLERWLESVNPVDELVRLGANSKYHFVECFRVSDEIAQLVVPRSYLNPISDGAGPSYVFEIDRRRAKALLGIGA